MTEKTEEVRILLIDDDESMASALVQDVEAMSRQPFRLPDGGCIRWTADVSFKCEWCKGLDELSSHLQGRTPAWDVLIVDRMMNGIDANVSILSTVADLCGRGIWIVWTAFPEQEDSQHPTTPNIVQCMRFGAWDYLNKNMPRRGSAFADVIASMVEGLEFRNKEHRRAETDRDGSRYVSEHFRDLYALYKGQFVAFRRDSKDATQWTVSEANPSLWGLYRALGAVERDQIHVTMICE